MWEITEWKDAEKLRGGEMMDPNEEWDGKRSNATFKEETIFKRS